MTGIDFIPALETYGASLYLSHSNHIMAVDPRDHAAIPMSMCWEKAPEHHFEYCQVGVIKAAHKGRKSWNPPEAMFLARFSTISQRKIDLTNAFKLFSDDSFKLCGKIDGFVGKRARARASARTREREAKGHKA